MGGRIGAARPRPTRTVVVIAVVAVVAVALVVGVVLGVRWWTQPDLFRDNGADIVRPPVPVKKAKVHVAVTFPPVQERGDTSLTFRDVEADFSTNTADAETRFWLCSDEAPSAVSRGPLRTICPDPQRISEGTRMTWSSASDSDRVVVTLVPRAPGVARLDEVVLDYALGAGDLYRRGTDTVDLDVTVKAR